MRAYEFINDILNTEVYESTISLNERFNDSIWLYNKLNTIVSTYYPKNIKDLYSKIMSDIISDRNFLLLFEDLNHIPIFYDIDLYNTNMISAKTSYDIRNDSIRFIKLTLNVPDYYLDNKTLISELDSVLGHEINHMIQKVKEYKNNHLTPKSDILQFVNDNHYINMLPQYMIQNARIVNYYLNKKELDSHSYTYSIRLWHQFKNDSIDIVKKLFNIVWSDDFDPSIKLTYDNNIIDRETVLGLYNFAESFKKSEERKLLKGKLTAYKLWKKLFSEMYKYLYYRTNSK